jgi:hypothetical protein
MVKPVKKCVILERVEFDEGVDWERGVPHRMGWARDDHLAIVSCGERASCIASILKV